MNYTVLRTEKADTQIRDLIYYIAEDSGSVETALDCLDKLEHSIRILAEQPYAGAEARHPSLRRMKFRVLAAERYLVFYKVLEHNRSVIIYAVVDSRQDYVKLVL